MKKYFFCFFIFSSITFNLGPETSLNQLTSWFSSNTKKTYNKMLDIPTDVSLHINNTHGAITIHTWSKPKIALDIVITTKEKDLKNINIQIEKDKKEKKIIVHTTETDNKIKSLVQYEIMVPDYTPLTLDTKTGDIRIEKSKAVINAKTGEGKIVITEAGNSLYVYTQNGSIIIEYIQLKQEHTVQVESKHGNIILGLPTSSQANIAAKTLNGTVTTQQEVMLKPQQVQLGPEAWKRFKQQAFCVLGNGGAAISLFTKNGNIEITEL